jgi:hypothetical protein
VLAQQNAEISPLRRKERAFGGDGGDWDDARGGFDVESAVKWGVAVWWDVAA